MPHRAEATPIDETLARLLDVERRLEARVRAAEELARARVAAARAAGEDLPGRDAELDAARAEEEEERARHGAALEGIAAETAERVAHLSAVPESVVERLARGVVASVLQGDTGRRA